VNWQKSTKFHLQHKECPTKLGVIMDGFRERGALGHLRFGGPKQVWPMLHISRPLRVTKMWFAFRSNLFMHGFSFTESRSVFAETKSGWQANFYFWYLKRFSSKDTHLWNVFLLLFLFAMNHNFKWNRKVLTKVQYSMMLKHFSTCHNANIILIS